MSEKKKPNMKLISLLELKINSRKWIHEIRNYHVEEDKTVKF